MVPYRHARKYLSKKTLDINDITKNLFFNSVILTYKYRAYMSSVRRVFIGKKKTSPAKCEKLCAG